MIYIHNTFIITFNEKTLIILEQNFKFLVIVCSGKRDRQLDLKLPFNFDLVNLELPIVTGKMFRS